MLNVVAIGGGTGLSTLLRGLREHVLSRFPGSLRAAGTSTEVERLRTIAELSAIVTVADDGGSSGRLRRAFGVLAPGDVRRCLVALSEDEDMLGKLFEYRFRRGQGLVGHTLGNLLLTALTKITGDFGRALEVASEVLATRGRIYPATLSHVRLRAELEGGRVVTGETRISRSTRPIVRLSLLPPQCKPVPEAIAAIDRADVIFIGPGSLYTSIIPNVLVKGLAKRIAASKALKVYVGNLMTQPGETNGMTASQHIEAIYQHAGAKILDCAILNGSQIPSRLLPRYAAEGAQPVQNDLDAVRRLGVRPILAELVTTGTVARRAVLRHNPERLARAVLSLVLQASIVKPQ
jgi:uncharacterized cofD-like protein